jgi:hypothetical protein
VPPPTSHLEVGGLARYPGVSGTPANAWGTAHRAYQTWIVVAMPDDVPGSLVILCDYPIAHIDKNHEYLGVTRGWARACSPGRGPEWWLQRNHVKAFKLDQYPAWAASYESGRSGTPELHVDLLSLPGIPGPRLQAWLINPDGVGGVYIVVIPVADILKAAETQATNSLAGGV